MSEEQKESTVDFAYFRKRMELYGITPEVNKVKLWKNVEVPKTADDGTEMQWRDNQLVDIPIFTGTDKGIQIIIYRLDRTQVTFKPEGSRWSKDNNITRLEVPWIDKKGDEHKYHIPKGAETLPFIPPHLIDKWEKREKIKTLVLTEGFFKAFKAAMHGLDIIGLSSITHYKDRDSGTLHVDIINIIKTCNVENVLWVPDGDCNRISLKALSEGSDIHKRPNGFFSSCKTIQRLLKDHDVHKFVCYPESMKFEGQPKGLDDLLIKFPGKEDEIIDDLLSLSKPAVYFFREDMSYSTDKLRKHFRLHSVNEFVEFHDDILDQMRKLTNADIKEVPSLKSKPFVWIGTQYLWDEKENACKIIVPGDAKKYFRVGDQYYKKVQIPNKYGQLENTFKKRQKQTIIDDYGKNFVEHIAKHEEFCNVPDHGNYKDIINNCYNMYFPFEHEAKEGDYFKTMSFLEHIFGNKEVKVKHKDKGEICVKQIDLGLDYIQLLYQQPQQVLPILCLVSKEQGTGKSTFGYWLKELFTQNVAIVGNADLANDFNASWAGKLLVICEEAKIDKNVVVEKVKALSTASKIFINAKGKDQTEIDFFAKFIFNSNNEENFIYAGDDDVRYWVIKVPVVQDLFVDLLADMRDEISAFLHFLNKRKLATEKLHRAWFYPELIKTEALKKVIAFSQSTVMKEIRQKIRDMFFDHGVSQVYMSLDAINESFFKRPLETNYLRRVITDELKLEQYFEWEYEGKDYDEKEIITLAKELGDKYDRKLLKKKNKTKRTIYPRWEIVRGDNKVSRERIWVKENGRPYVFKIEKFLTQDEIETRWIDPETANDVKINESMDPKTWGEKSDHQSNAGVVAAVPAGEQDDLPF
jgi:hypothetical protein